MQLANYYGNREISSWQTPIKWNHAISQIMTPISESMLPLKSKQLSVKS